LDNWRRGGEEGVSIIVVTDGSRILGNYLFCRSSKKEDWGTLVLVDLVSLLVSYSYTLQERDLTQKTLYLLSLILVNTLPTSVFTLKEQSRNGILLMRRSFILE
jgi:hypothetical protein